jgi:hypothetical protein
MPFVDKVEAMLWAWEATRVSSPPPFESPPLIVEEEDDRPNVGVKAAR